MFPCNCHPPFPRPEPFSPLPRPGHVPDWGKWIRDRLAEKGALLAFPTRTAFPSAGSAPNLYLAEDTGVVYRWGGEGYAVLVDPSPDVETYPGRSAFPDTGRAGAIYIDASTNLLYRWDGTGYVLLTTDLSGVESRLADVESKVPAQATAQNQLADKAFVNSSVATNTAFYISDNGRPFQSLADLESYEGALTNNDYAFVVGRDAAGNTTYTRYKWNEATEAWGEEYVLNNSSFTAEQWAAISSGITSGLVAKLGALPTAEALAAALAGKADKINSVFYAICDTAAATSNKVASTEGNDFFTLREGAKVVVNFANGCATQAVTLDVDGTGAKPVYRRGTTNIGDGAWSAKQSVMMVYDGAAYLMLTPAVANSNEYGVVHISDATDGTSSQTAVSQRALSNSIADKADKSDATLTERGFSEWSIASTSVDPSTIHLELETDGWVPKSPNGTSVGAPKGNAQSVSLEWTARVDGPFNITATRTALPGYQLGSQSDKPLASEAEAEALRDGKLDKSGAIWNVSYTENGLRIADNAEVYYIDISPSGVRTNFPNDAHEVFWPINGGPLALLENIAPAFSTSSTYALNALCVYDRVLYRCTTAITTAENWTPAHWTQATVEDILAALRTGKANDNAVVKLTGDQTISGVKSFYSGITMANGADIDFTAGGRVIIRNTSISAVMVLNHDGIDYSTDGGLNYVHFDWPSASGTLALTVDLLAKLDSTSAAPAFSSDSSTQYPVGSHVTYNSKLYKCTTATTGGTWVAGSWTADTMTDPDAVLDVTSQNQLRVVAKDGTVLWAQGYDLASTSSATLACDAVNNFTFADGATTQAFALPTVPTGKVGDFGLDIDNSANTGAATMTLTGLDTTFSVVVPKGESLTDMLSIAAGELARFYVTLTTFRVNNLPTWHIVKQIVENGGVAA